MRGYAPLGRLLGLAMITAGLGTFSLATPEAAYAANTDSPTAIGVASDGTSYVGFATGGKLIRLSPKGKLKGSINLDQDEAVDGIYVTAGNDIWVDYETGFSLLKPTGKRLAHYSHVPAKSCTSKAPPSKYGGITANGNRIYIANRCDDSISVYARNGDLLATVDLPGNSYPRGITYGIPQAGRPATLYVAVPDRGQVLSYKANSLHNKTKPTRVFTLRRPSGGKKPQPAGVVVDKWGQLTVSDMANNALYLYDTNNNFSNYRTLGHPPHASRQAGRLNGASALAQHAQDGGHLSGNLWIADTNNNRVQNWNNSGYTFWAKGVRAGSGGGDGGGNGNGNGNGNGDGDGNGNGDGNGDGDGDGGGDTGDGPTNSVRPSISGDPSVGSVLTCNKGTWSESGGPSGSNTYAFRWQRDGTDISSAISASYTVVTADDGKDLTCSVRATNGSGSTVAKSAAVTIDDGGGSPGGSAPLNTVAPTISGTAAVGEMLTCNPGAWTGGGITYGYQWRRAGAAIPSATAGTYTVVAADNGTALTCTVKATNSSGNAEAVSAAVTVGGGGSGGTGPVNTVAPTISGTAAVGQVLTCNPGTWTGSGISYGYQWRRAGTAIASATNPTYAVTAADSGAALTCAVKATNSSGNTEAVSASVTVGGGGSGGTGPVNTDPPSIAGSPAVGQNLFCSPGTWTGIGLTYSYQWRRGGVAITAANSATYTVLAADVGSSLTCVVTAANGTGSTEVASAAVTVGGGSGGPVNTVAPQILGNPAVGQLLNCSSGIWTGLGISYTYKWLRAGAAIASATSANYRVTAADSGAALSCIVRAVNGSGTVEVVSAPVVIGGGGSGTVAPINVTLPTISGTATVGQVLTCSPGTWSGVGVSYGYQWRRAGTAIGSATASTYTVVAADSGTALTCVVRASNAAGNTDAVSAAVTVGGGGSSTAPVNLVPPSISGTASVGQVLTCNPGSWTFTGVGVGYSYQWLRGGAAIGSATASTYTVVAADSGTALSCVVRASNSGGSTDAAAPAVTVGGGGSSTAPVNLVQPTISGTSTVGQVLTCNPGTWTFTGVGISYGYQWLRAGVAIGSATSSTYTVAAADSGSSLSCVVRASNSGGSTDAASASVTVGGGSATAPVNLVSPTITGTPTVGQVLTCNPGTWTFTGVGISYGYQWLRAGAAIGSATSSTYTVAAADSGSSLSCVVRASNTGGSTDAASASVTVSGGGGSTAPVNVVPPSITGSPTVGGVLTCNPGSWNGSGVTYSYQWQRSGTTIGTATTSTYVVVSADDGGFLSCLVRASSPSGSTDAVSAAITIGSSGPGGGSGPAPINLVPPSISGTPSVGQTLACNPGTWSISGFGYGYTWQRSGIPISSATLSTYIPTAADVGSSLRCLVRVVTGGGIAEAVSAGVFIS